jgi:hypothetical protein
LIQGSDGASLTCEALAELIFRGLDRDNPVQSRVAGLNTSPISPAPIGSMIWYGPGERSADDGIPSILQRQERLL